MPPWMRLSLALVLALSALLLGSRPASACSCVDPGPPSAVFGYMPVVFRGVVTGVSAGSPWGPVVAWLQSRLGLAGSPAGALYVRFRVTQSWKGQTTTSATVVQSGICGYGFDLQRDYVVYAWPDTYGLTTSMCTRTADVGQASADLAYLRTQPLLTLQASPPALAWALVVAPAVGGLAVLAVTALAVRRRLRRKQKGLF
ncbi:MAG: hypothetical protein IT317_07205 [Anaerolineales bacterium]|nr:hypothetical protein [Anaerolineales bacterium]